jgi:hypothetical protein
MTFFLASVCPSGVVLEKRSVTHFFPVAKNWRLCKSGFIIVSRTGTLP